jgi:hypothetical protein
MAHYVPNPPPFLTPIMTGAIQGALRSAAPDMEAVAATYRAASDNQHSFTTNYEFKPGPGLPNVYLECSVTGEYAEFYEYGSETKPGTHAAQAAAEEAS